MSPVSKTKIIALTGSMGAGKSSAGKIISQYYPVLDCDKVNAFLLEPGQEGFLKLKEKNLIPFDWKEIDKVQLSKWMFEDPQFKKDVEAVLHPLIFEKVDQWKNQQNTKAVFVEVPLLFEIQAQDKFDEVWCVITDEKTALQRLQEFRNVPLQEAKKRLKAQLSPEYKASLSDVVLYNDADLDHLKKQIQRNLEKLA